MEKEHGGTDIILSRQSVASTLQCPTCPQLRLNPGQADKALGQSCPVVSFTTAQVEWSIAVSLVFLENSGVTARI